MNKFEGSTLESLFEETGELEEVRARATKQALAIQAERRMKELGLTATGLATRMRTSRNQIHRILDRDDAGITLKMLFRLAEALALPLVVALGEGTADVGGDVSSAQGQRRRTQRVAAGPRKTRPSRARRPVGANV